MTDNATADRTPDPVHFDAILMPHRSLSRNGFWLVMLLIAVPMSVVAGAFVAMGAWPIIGWFGVDLLLVYLAFRWNFRSARSFETLTLTESALTVKVVDHWGAERRHVFAPPHWLNVAMDDPPKHESRLMLRSHGRNLTVGGFLTPEERLEVATALKAALNRMRSAAPQPSTARQPKLESGGHP